MAQKISQMTRLDSLPASALVPVVAPDLDPLVNYSFDLAGALANGLTTVETLDDLRAIASIGIAAR